MMNLTELKRKTTFDLSELAAEYRLTGVGAMKRHELIFALLKAEGEGRGDITAEGVLETLPDGFGFLRAPDSGYLPGPDDVYVSPSQIRRFHLRTGDTLSGRIRPPKESERYFALLKVESVNGLSPEDRTAPAVFEELAASHPRERMTLEHDPADLSTRAIDLLAPIGRGQRCLVASPPRTGKTALLKDIARGIERNHPDVHVMVLLVDARPEEVTDMKRALRGEVIASTVAEPPQHHVQVAEIVTEKAKRLAEQGRDVAVMLDSLTKLARAYNVALPPAGRHLPGGLDAGAVHRTKRCFGAARKLDEGGSLTMVATVLAGSGSPADEVVYEECRGAQNAEIRLDRRLWENRLAPCIDVGRSGTTREELLLPRHVLERVTRLRQLLHPLGSVEAAEALRDKLVASETNDALIASLGA